MIMNYLFSWIFWDPTREAFTIPFFDRPVTYYGILFATGIAICYLLLIYIFKHQIWRIGVVTQARIKNWPQFLKELQDRESVLTFFPDDSHDTIQNHKGPVTEELKQQIIDGLNKVITTYHFAVTREAGFKKLHDIFPKTFATSHERALYLVDRLLWYAIIGTLVGARLGHFLFYDLSHFLQNPSDIFWVWQGGMGSHGAVVGILLAIYVYYLRYRIYLPGNSFLDFLDLFVIPTPIAGACIRLGNFMNQEVLGTPTEVPWAVIFAHPIDGRAVIPRHPVMLYEAIASLVIFAICFTLWKKRGTRLNTGFLSGLFFLLVFSSRFILEFFKVVQTNMVLIPGLRMGQVLSVPFIILGAYLIWHSYRNQDV
nr:Prolipoprotein diacylglyceryl transferase [Chlamydiota bacterium]